jgi:uncharacterized protein
MKNPVGWFEIYVSEMERAKAFYRDVFAADFTRLPNLSAEVQAFTMNPEGYGASGALVHMPGFTVGSNSVIVYFNCLDCSVTAARAVVAGGRLQKPKTSIGPHGFIALVYDTEGNLIGLHSRQ